MIRRIIIIDKEACNGCGLCVDACHEGAIGLKDGKAVLLRDDYCDGLGDCLPACPTGAISFEEREALPYDEAAVLANMARKKTAGAPSGCPGSHARSLQPLPFAPQGMAAMTSGSGGGMLRQWPVQIRLAPVTAPYYQGAGLLISADCAAYAYGNFHQDFMDGKVTLIGCPKLDDVDYREKLTAILAANDIASVTVARMSVPCCGGLEAAVKEALAASGKDIPYECRVIAPDGTLQARNVAL